MVWMESPTNPTLNLIDIAAVAALARKRGILSVCDNTFATPFIQRPLDLGVDIVMHSATKYLNGHSMCSRARSSCAIRRWPSS